MSSEFQRPILMHKPRISADVAMRLVDHDDEPIRAIYTAEQLRGPQPAYKAGSQTKADSASPTSSSEHIESLFQDDSQASSASSPKTAGTLSADSAGPSQLRQASRRVQFKEIDWKDDEASRRERDLEREQARERDEARARARESSNAAEVEAVELPLEGTIETLGLKKSFSKRMSSSARTMGRAAKKPFSSVSSWWSRQDSAISVSRSQSNGKKRKRSSKFKSVADRVPTPYSGPSLVVLPLDGAFQDGQASPRAEDNPSNEINDDDQLLETGSAYQDGATRGDARTFERLRSQAEHRDLLNAIESAQENGEFDPEAIDERFVRPMSSYDSLQSRLVHDQWLADLVFNGPESSRGLLPGDDTPLSDLGTESSVAGSIGRWAIKNFIPTRDTPTASIHSLEGLEYADLPFLERSPTFWE